MPNIQSYKKPRRQDEVHFSLTQLGQTFYIGRFTGFFFRSRVLGGGGTEKKKKSSENDQIFFRSFFFHFRAFLYLQNKQLN